MPLDFSIPMSVRPIDFGTPFKTLAGWDQARQQKEMSDMAIQGERRKMDDLRRRDESESAISDAMRRADGNFRTAADILRAEGRVSESESVWGQGIARAKQITDSAKSELELNQSVIDSTARMLASINKPTGDRATPVSVGETGDKTTFVSGGRFPIAVPFTGGEETPEWRRASEAYRALRPQVVDTLARIDPSLASELPEDYDPDKIESFLARSTKYKDIMAERAEALKAASSAWETAQKQGKHDMDMAPFVAGIIGGHIEDDEDRERARGLGKNYGLSEATVESILRMTPEARREFASGRSAPNMLAPKFMLVKGEDGKWQQEAVSFNPQTNQYFAVGSKTPLDAGSVRDLPEKTTGSGTGAAASSGFPAPVREAIWGLMENGVPRPAAQARANQIMSGFRRQYPSLDPASVNKMVDELYGGPVLAGDRPGFERDTQAWTQAMQAVGRFGNKAAARAAIASQRDATEDYEQRSALDAVLGIFDTQAGALDAALRIGTEGRVSQPPRGDGWHTTVPAAPARSGGAGPVGGPTTMGALRDAQPAPASQVEIVPMDSFVSSLGALSPEDIQALKKMPFLQEFELEGPDGKETWRREGAGFRKISR